MVSANALVTRLGKDNEAYLHLENVNIPGPEPDQVQVRVHAVAQNPTDVQCLDLNAFGEGAVLGCDFVGTVESTGANVVHSQEGDVIAGLIWGGETPGIGGYSERTFATEDIYFKIPKSVKFVDAANVPLASTTAWLALFSSRCLNIKRNGAEKTPLLIWGGSSSVGLFAIQLAKIYEIPTVAICSPKNFDLCKSVGASWIFDHNESNVVDMTKAEVSGIAHAFDCIGAGTSSAQASQAIDSLGGKLTNVRPGKANTENVESRVVVSDVLVWTAFYKDHSYKEFQYPASREDHELAAELYQNIPVWLEESKIRPNAVKTIPGGLSAVSKGFDMHREGKISGFKIVYEL